MINDSPDPLRRCLERSLAAWDARARGDADGALARLENAWDGVEALQTEGSGAVASRLRQREAGRTLPQV
jgi:hypothetical protein